MGRGKTDAEVRRNAGHFLQQPRKGDGLGPALPQVAVHVLSQQRNFLVTFLIHVAGLAHDGSRVAGTLGPAGIGNHAVRANVVAAAHDGDEGRYPIAVCPHRGDVGVGLVAGKEHVNLRAVRADGIEKPGQRAVGVRTHDKVYLVRVQELVLQALGHAAYDAYDEAGLSLSQLMENLDAAPDALLGVVADAAGVGHHQVCLFHLLRPLVAGIGQDGKDHLGVIHVHLTPVCLNVCFLFHGLQRYEKILTAPGAGVPWGYPAGHGTWRWCAGPLCSRGPRVRPPVRRR